MEGFWIKTEGCVAIPVTEDTRKGLDLLTISPFNGFTVPYTTSLGIESKMSEHGELTLMPPLKSVGRDLCVYA